MYKKIVKKRGFDYYIYIDYSENLIGYNIIDKRNISEILVIKNNIKSLLLKYKIEKIRYNTFIFADVLEFVKTHNNCVIFISADNNQYDAFIKLFRIIPHKKHAVVIRESSLKEGSIEYKLSLIIDNLLNIERIKSR